MCLNPQTLPRNFRVWRNGNTVILCGGIKMIAASHSNNKILINTLLNLNQPCDKLKARELSSAISREDKAS